MSRHVVVLQHGMWGSQEDLRNIRTALEASFPGVLSIVISDVNVGNTEDGVEAGGARLAEMIRNAVPIGGCRLSVVGHSLGGIYARYALRLLEEQDWFDTASVKAGNFVTLATPHLGISEVSTSMRVAIRIGGWFANKTAYDLALHGSPFRQAVFLKLADDTALSSLRRFHRVAIYGNVAGDELVKPCTSLLVPQTPNINGMSPGLPTALDRESLGQTCTLVFAGAFGGDLATFGILQRKKVRAMLTSLNDLSIERYAVYFPEEAGDAHVKICNHGSQDPENSGRHVLDHICQTFVHEDICLLPPDATFPEATFGPPGTVMGGPAMATSTGSGSLINVDLTSALLTIAPPSPQPTFMFEDLSALADV